MTGLQAADMDSYVNALIDDSLRELVHKVAKVLVLTPRDRELIALARKKAIDECDCNTEKLHKLAACGLGRSGMLYSSLQYDVSQAHESSVCAEAGVYMKANECGDKIETIVTFHGADQAKKYYEPRIAPPCAQCHARLRCYAPSCKVIVEYEGEIVKLPLRLCALIPYFMRNKAR